jgi:hypothetical protein
MIARFKKLPIPLAPGPVESLTGWIPSVVPFVPCASSSKKANPWLLVPLLLNLATFAPSLAPWFPVVSGSKIASPGIHILVFRPAELKPIRGSVFLCVPFEKMSVRDL